VVLIFNHPLLITSLARVTLIGLATLILVTLSPAFSIYLIPRVCFSGKAESNLLLLCHQQKLSILVQPLPLKNYYDFKHLLVNSSILYSFRVLYYVTINLSCLVLTKNPRFHDRSKYINICFHFFRDHVANKLLQLIHTPTSQMWVDILTKSLPKVKHHSSLHRWHL